MTPKLRWFLITVAVSVPLDRLTKWWIDSSLPFGDRRPVIEGFFYLTHARNPGIAFGMLDQVPDPWRTLGFALVSLVAAAVIVSFLFRLAPGDRFGALALGLVFGGAVGNFIDRIALGEVIDFLHFRLWAGYSWPDFNLADVCIVVGVGMLVFALLVAEGEQEEAPRPASGPSGSEGESG
jgi:signal peptidase II